MKGIKQLIVMIFVISITHATLGSAEDKNQYQPNEPGRETRGHLLTTDFSERISQELSKAGINPGSVASQELTFIHKKQRYCAVGFLNGNIVIYRLNSDGTILNPTLFNDNSGLGGGAVSAIAFADGVLYMAQNATISKNITFNPGNIIFDTTDIVTVDHRVGQGHVYAIDMKKERPSPPKIILTAPAGLGVDSLMPYTRNETEFMFGTFSGYSDVNFSESYGIEFLPAKPVPIPMESYSSKGTGFSQKDIAGLGYFVTSGNLPSQQEVQGLDFNGISSTLTVDGIQFIGYASGQVVAVAFLNSSAALLGPHLFDKGEGQVSIMAKMNDKRELIIARFRENGPTTVHGVVYDQDGVATSKFILASENWPRVNAIAKGKNGVVYLGLADGSVQRMALKPDGSKESCRQIHPPGWNPIQTMELSPSENIIIVGITDGTVQKIALTPDGSSAGATEIYNKFLARPVVSINYVNDDLIRVTWGEKNMKHKVTTETSLRTTLSVWNVSNSGKQEALRFSTNEWRPLRENLFCKCSHMFFHNGTPTSEDPEPCTMEDMAKFCPKTESTSEVHRVY